MEILQQCIKSYRRMQYKLKGCFNSPEAVD